MSHIPRDVCYINIVINPNTFLCYRKYQSSAKYMVINL